MDTILDKLTEIEDAANRILGRTAEQKAKISQEMKEKTESFDRALQEETDRKIAALRQSLQQQREENLSHLRDYTQEQMDALEAACEKNHERLAEMLVQRILEA
ncbi:MAG: hypothetical protein LUF00_10355 [Lachnospiraceae bacterium]|nr:hypothetical protein [Lachnospiraceae bacterium]